MRVHKGVVRGACGEMSSPFPHLGVACDLPHGHVPPHQHTGTNYKIQWDSPKLTKTIAVIAMAKAMCRLMSDSSAASEDAVWHNAPAWQRIQYTRLALSAFRVLAVKVPTLGAGYDTGLCLCNTELHCGADPGGEVIRRHGETGCAIVNCQTCGGELLSPA